MNSRDLSGVKSAFQVTASKSSSLKPVLAKILDAIGRDDFAAIADHLTEQVELHIAGFDSMDGSWRGRERVLEALAANFDKITEQKPEPEAMIEGGGRIAMLIRESGRWKERQLLQCARRHLVDVRGQPARQSGRVHRSGLN